MSGLLFSRLASGAINFPLSLLGLRLSRSHAQDAHAATDVDQEVRIGGFNLTAPGSSPLPKNYSQNPDHSSQLGRLASAVAGQYPDSVIIDVGANIGDTAAIIRNYCSLPIFCVEGDDICFPYLSKNIKQFGNATARKTFLGEKRENIRAIVQKEGFNGTLVPSESAGAKSLRIETLDDVVAEHLTGRHIKVLKVDAEGFDTRILRGSRATIAKHKPVVFFEYNRNNMSAIGETGIDTLWMLRDLGYDTACVFADSGRFLMQTRLGDESIIRDLHEFADGFRSAIYYYDLCAFHLSDSVLSERVASAERDFRACDSGPREG